MHSGCGARHRYCGTLLSACRGGVVPSFEYDSDIYIHKHDRKRMVDVLQASAGLTAKATWYKGAWSDNIYGHGSKTDIFKAERKGKMLLMVGAEKGRRDHTPLLYDDVFPLQDCVLGDTVMKCPSHTEKVLRQQYDSLAKPPVHKRSDGSYEGCVDDTVCFSFTPNPNAIVAPQQYPCYLKEVVAKAVSWTVPL